MRLLVLKQLGITNPLIMSWTQRKYQKENLTRKHLRMRLITLRCRMRNVLELEDAQAGIQALKTSWNVCGWCWGKRLSS